ncbi:MAG: hypothetical protein IT373_36510 [Polyangiaceae bacterium]|nr:hypothetical protein [Polyangiaceae bacterium]
MGAGGGVGFLFLSNEVQPLQKKRDQYVPAQAEVNAVRLDVLKRIFDPTPETKLEGVKVVQAGIRLGRAVVTGESSDVLFRLAEHDAHKVDEELARLASESQTREEYANVVTWLFVRPSDAEDRLVDVCRSSFIQVEGARTRDHDKVLGADVTRYLRSEERRAERAKETAKASYEDALLRGWLVFRGMKRPVAELGPSVLVGASSFLGDAAKKVFHHFALVKRNVAADVAAKFLEIDRLDRMPKERDPLALVQKKAGRPSIDTGHPALAEALRAFRSLSAAAGSGRVQGSVLLEQFNGPPYGWSKDTTRYLFAALLTASEVEIHSGDGVLRTAGPKAFEAFKNTQSFGRVGVAARGEVVPPEALDRASRRLEEMFAVEVLPLEDQVSRVVRTHFPTVLERAGALPDRLRLLGLGGEARARAFLEACADLLKEDAGGAASLLGGVQSALPADKKWVESVTGALDRGGEREIGRARAIVERVRALGELFPAAAPLGRHAAMATIADVLGSESFSDRLADLREAERELQGVAEQLYAAEQAALGEALDGARERLEARASWARVAEADRDTAARELAQAQAPPAPAAVFAALPLALTKRLGARMLEEELARRIDTLAAEPAVSAAAGSPGEPRLGTVPEMVAMNALLPSEPLASAADVEKWLVELRARLLELVELGPIRLTGKP